MEAEKRTRPQERWNEKNQYISKSFKMYKSVADEFAQACDKAGVSQSGQIVSMMKQFIEQVNAKK